MDRTAKQEKFTAPKKNNNMLFIIVGVVLIAGVMAGVFFLGGKENNAKAAFNVGSEVNYQSVEMTTIENTVSNGKVAIDLEAVKKAGIIYTEYDQNGKKLALTAWVANNGNVVTAVSLCEPCRGYKFHIEGTDLVCNACGTRWTLDSLQGISGGCLTYPPDSLEYEVVDGKILMNEAEIVAWQPRP